MTGSASQTRMLLALLAHAVSVGTIDKLTVVLEPQG